MYSYKTLILCTLLSLSTAAYVPTPVERGEEYPYLVLITLEYGPHAGEHNTIRGIPGDANPKTTGASNATKAPVPSGTTGKPGTGKTTVKPTVKQTVKPTTKPVPPARKKRGEKVERTTCIPRGSGKGENGDSGYGEDYLPELYVATGTIVNLYWVLTLAHKIGSQEYIDKPLIVFGAGVSKIPAYLDDLGNISIYRVGDKNCKTPSSQVEVFSSQNLCLLRTKRAMSAHAAFMGWAPRMSKNYPAVTVESLYWVWENDHYQKYKMSWLPYTELPDNRLMCSFFTEAEHICLTTTLSKNTLESNTGPNFPCDNDTFSDGGPIMIDNQMHGVFIGLETPDNEICSKPPADKEGWKDKYYFAGIRTITLDSDEDAFQEISSIFDWMRTTVDKKVKHDENLFRLSPGRKKQRTKKGKLFRLDNVKLAYVNRTWRCELNKYEEFAYHLYLIVFFMLLLNFF